jgi:hypothetical protein
MAMYVVAKANVRLLNYLHGAISTRAIQKSATQAPRPGKRARLALYAENPAVCVSSFLSNHMHP